MARRLAIFLVLAAAVSITTSVAAENISQPVGWVNDFANCISDEYEQKLIELISEVEAKTSSEVTVVTVASMAPYDEAGYARLLFDRWKPGKKGKDNGVLVLLAIKERAWRIETGYGVEGILPDGLCGEIGRNYMVPYFKEGKYAEGLYNGVLQVSRAIGGEDVTSHRRRQNDLEIKSLGILSAAIALLFLPWSVFFILSVIIILILILLGAFSVLKYAPAVIAILALIKLSLGNRYSYGDNYWYRDGYVGGGGFGGGGGSFGGFGGGGGGGGGAGGRF